ncbi:DUF2793 domain-containing protein [Sphingobium nicotianae]|uniref:DUF2793 domain-containing protein n=1 Tax=Sphingobium nicotianae TaxID=2782607 RepID=A0A9X1DBD6_9SPHN|nr:DUF2793 domain-containing protein [Sphingobium nicotianae]MBT2186866.1 DUF2793 domain-containing protein [Sphingobium nicotianae]
MAQTDRLGLPLLAAGQAQKEVTHNEALILLDCLTQAAVESADLAAPPMTPSPGQCWIVGSGATGEWADRDAMLAAWTASGWLFASPRTGWRVWAIDRANGVRFNGAHWIDEPAQDDGYYVDDERVVGARQGAIVSVTGGAVQDSEARAAIAAILSALRVHGLIEN